MKNKINPQICNAKVSLVTDGLLQRRSPLKRYCFWRGDRSEITVSAKIVHRRVSESRFKDVYALFFFWPTCGMLALKQLTVSSEENKL
ncbi:MAG: hypothetical protein F6K24_10515 [Okeania sp. SIO2D1]|nr:hypothetical protein [Okeania sp. SIO2D1]